MTGLMVLVCLAATIGALLGWASGLFPESRGSLVSQIEELLPQTQCAQCSYPGCKPYAQALANNDAEINQCPPGGVETIQRLADLLGKKVVPLNTEFGATKPLQVAIIREPDCIGCTLCIQACPVDAIVGASKFMHTVVASYCTGCELCLPPCPVDCIDLIPTAATAVNKQ